GHYQQVVPLFPDAYVAVDERATHARGGFEPQLRQRVEQHATGQDGKIGKLHRRLTATVYSSAAITRPGSPCRRHSSHTPGSKNATASPPALQRATNCASAMRRSGCSCSPNRSSPSKLTGCSVRARYGDSVSRY